MILDQGNDTRFVALLKLSKFDKWSLVKRFLGSFTGLLLAALGGRSWEALGHNISPNKNQGKRAIPCSPSQASHARFHLAKGPDLRSLPAGTAPGRSPGPGRQADKCGRLFPGFPSERDVRNRFLLVSTESRGQLDEPPIWENPNADPWIGPRHVSTKRSDSRKEENS